MKTLDTLTKTEKSLLLFAECACVDSTGIYRSERTNQATLDLLDQWKAEGFADHGRVASEDLTDTRKVWVQLSPAAMELAHALRRERAERMWKNRDWRTTAEKRDQA